MSENKFYSISNQDKTKANTYPKSSFGIVVDPILDDTNIKLKKIDSDRFNGGLNNFFSNNMDTTDIGSVYIRPLDELNTKSRPFPYRPFDATNIEMPLIGEKVQLVEISGVRYYKRLYSSNLNVGDSAEDRINTNFPQSSAPNDRFQDYQSVSTTGTPKKSTSVTQKIGNYFTPIKINYLKFYEGDKIIQSRFGQSIRFSGYNNEEREFSPTIIIRNRQNDKSLVDKKIYDIIEEDINRDGSTIAMTSNSYKINFIPGVIDENNGTDFKTEPKNFKLPEEYVGDDQIFMNSDRVLISARSKEMLFFSKGDYGFISDGKFIIDNGINGAEMDFGGDVNIRTNNNDFYVNTGDIGRILLNTDSESEPLVRGDVLKTLMEELIDLIADMQFATPSGPTANGPINKIDFIKLKRKLRDFLSTKNFTE